MRQLLRDCLVPVIAGVCGGLAVLAGLLVGARQSPSAVLPTAALIRGSSSPLSALEVRLVMVRPGNAVPSVMGAAYLLPQAPADVPPQHHVASPVPHAARLPTRAEARLEGGCHRPVQTARGESWL